MGRQIGLVLVAVCLGIVFGAWHAARADDSQPVFVVGTCVELIPSVNIANATRQPVVIAVAAVSGPWVKTKAVPQGNLFNSGAWINTNELMGVRTAQCPANP
jgi:hypothetical protein